MKQIHSQSLRFLICAVIIAGAFAVAPTGCKNVPISDTVITTSVSAGTAAGLKLTVKDPAKQKVIAQYLNTYAGALRTIVGDPTDEQLTTQLVAFIPPNIQTEYPELQSFAVPMVVSFYHWAKEKYGANSTDLQRVLGDVASGIEAGSAPFLH
jgi:hypothetical protein